MRRFHETLIAWMRHLRSGTTSLGAPGRRKVYAAFWFALKVDGSRLGKDLLDQYRCPVVARG